MSGNNNKYNELLSTVPDSLLIANGYNPKDDCNCSGPVDSDGKIILGNTIIFGRKPTDLESVFDPYVVEKNKLPTWAYARVREAAWRL